MEAMPNTIRTTILIISDTHCAQLSNDDGNSTFPVPPFKSPLPKADLLIHCGDLTGHGSLEHYRQALDMLREIDAPIKLVIAGNHDLTLDPDFVRGHLDKPGAQYNWHPCSKDLAEDIIHKAKKLWLSPEGRARTEGVQLLEEGIHDINLPNGARIKVYASPYTPEFCDWSFAYGHNQDRRSESSLTGAVNIATNPIPSFGSAEGPIDICITHGPPYRRLDRTVPGSLDVGCPHLWRAVMRARPLIHCFGHIHEGWGGERVTWSYNADQVSTESTSLAAWRAGGWTAGVEKGGKGIERLDVDLEKAKSQHGSFVDLTATGGLQLRRGAETLFLNASIMSVRYDPINPPWVLDVDLPASARVTI